MTPKTLPDLRALAKAERSARDEYNRTPCSDSWQRLCDAETELHEAQRRDCTALLDRIEALEADKARLDRENDAATVMRDQYLARAERAERERDAYRQAIHRIDDRTEYREFTRADITAILADLTRALTPEGTPDER
jgi:hypothetical protein